MYEKLHHHNNTRATKTSANLVHVARSWVKNHHFLIFIKKELDSL